MADKKMGHDTPIAFNTELMGVVDLKPHPRNYRTHTEDQLAHLIESIKSNGYYRNVVIAREATILAGHGVVEASKRMGIEHIPVVRLDLDPDDPRALKILTGDNEIGRLAEIDDRALTEMLKQIMGEDPSMLLGTGYDDRMLAALVMVTRPQTEIEDFDAAAEWLGMPDYDQGTLDFTLMVSFESDESREDFLSKAGCVGKTRAHSGGRNMSLRWPPGMHDTKSVEFKGSDE